MGRRDISPTSSTPRPRRLGGRRRLERPGRRRVAARRPPGRRARRRCGSRLGERCARRPLAERYARRRAPARAARAAPADPRLGGVPRAAPPAHRCGARAAARDRGARGVGARAPAPVAAIDVCWRSTSGPARDASRARWRRSGPTSTCSPSTSRPPPRWSRGRTSGPSVSTRESGSSRRICSTGSAISDADLIVSNPPYLPSDARADPPPEVRSHEPRLALDGGPDGLAVIRRIAAAARRYVRPQARSSSRRPGAIRRRRPRRCCARRAGTR